MCTAVNAGNVERSGKFKTPITCMTTMTNVAKTCPRLRGLLRFISLLSLLFASDNDYQLDDIIVAIALVSTHLL